MNVALTTSHGRIAPCFSGVELRVVEAQSDLETAKVVVTRGWHPLAWGQELMRHDVNVLLCAGIDQVLWAGIRGYGIHVIPNAMGDPGEVLSQWSVGRLVAPQTWPMLPGMPGPGRGSGGGQRRRFRGGR